MGWIRTASIFGFILSAIALIYFFYSFISGLSSDPFADVLNNSQSEGDSLIFPIIMGLILFGAFFFFMFGFVKTGEKTNHNMLRRSSWMVYLSAAFILILVLVLSVKSVTNDYAASVGELNDQIDFSDFNFDSSDFGAGDFTGNAVGDITGEFFSSDMTFLLILFILGMLTFLVGIHLFYVSIAEHRDKIKFARPSAIFGLFTLNIIFLVAAMSIFLLLLLLTSGSFWVVFLTHISYMLGILTLVFMSFFLKDSSEKFEDGRASPPVPMRKMSYRN
ncbi:MAG: hypothetical protein KKB31_04330 [Nanoarchaeota archaeon]|nr:hypothetical protein [Nanoarchaeota archaeon]